MDGPSLSGREKRLLEQIEASLLEDQKLDRRMRTLGGSGPARSAQVFTRARRAACLTLLCLLTAVLMVAAVRAPEPELIVAFSVSWVITVVLGLVWLCAWCRGKFR